MAKHDTDEPSVTDADAADGSEAVAGRAARTNRKREPQARVATRSAGHVRSGARALIREAHKILRKHAARLDPAVAKEIEATVVEIEQLRGQRPNEDIAELEYQAEHLDELLHHHASFARKGALRDTLENIGIAVLVALTVRSCVYEPFKIPSGSMMPTLRAGDHIFVNKFIYGVQIPLTTTIVGEDWVSTIKRGDVIVFRYPLDQADDFIKRVIGLPGDTIRVNGDRRKLEIKRAGTERFETVEREALADTSCRAENSAQAIDNCTVYRETLDEHTYEVRYRDDFKINDPSRRIYEVPEGYVLVMGDNRNASHDSLEWHMLADTVSAAGVLSRADVRDITHKKDRIELHDGGDVIRANDGARDDRARYIAERPAPDRDFVLEAWRAPRVNVNAVFESLAHHHQATEATTLAAIIGGPADKPTAVDELPTPEIGEVRYGDHGGSADLIFRAPAPHDDVVFRLHCGRKRCLRSADIATRAGWVIQEFETNPEYAARELLVREPGRADTYPGRGKQAERYFERRFGAGFGATLDGVHIRAWRSPGESMAVLRDAALAEFGAGPLAAVMREHYGQALSTAAAVPDLGDDAWIVERDSGWGMVIADPKLEMIAVLECGRRRCKTQADALTLAAEVASRFPAAAQQADRLPELLGQSDAGNFPEVPVAVTPLYYWDHLSFIGAVLDDSHAIAVEIDWKPEVGLEAALEARKQALGTVEPVENLGPAAWYALTPNGHTYLFAVLETDLVVELSCRSGMCPDRETAQALAERAREKGTDPGNFVQKGVNRPRPFVPRGNVKGRAEVIWWPTSRFWKKID